MDKNTQDYIKSEIQFGDLVRIEGRVRQSDYEDKKTSEKVQGLA